MPLPHGRSGQFVAGAVRSSSAWGAGPRAGRLSEAQAAMTRACVRENREGRREQKPSACRVHQAVGSGETRRHQCSESRAF